MARIGGMYHLAPLRFCLMILKIIDDLLQAVSLVPPVSKIARAAGRIRGTYGLKLADSLIATTALYTGSTLLTRNVRDSKKIPPLSLQAI
jgi:predicted nucleic acid-binding protein